MSNSLSSSSDLAALSDTDPDSPMEDVREQAPPFSPFMAPNHDAEEARLESREMSKFLLAKSFFDCREFERCAAVFLPANLPRGPLTDSPPNAKVRTSPKTAKGKGKETGAPTTGVLPPPNALPHLSQRSLFLALYARYMSGEKRKNEESEMILGPADGGSITNKELVGLGRHLEGWFADREAKGLSSSNQGWLEYLYGLILAKGKTEEDAKKWLLNSVHRYPYNWGAWLELSELLDGAEDVCKMTAASSTTLTAYHSFRILHLSYRKISCPSCSISTPVRPCTSRQTLHMSSCGTSKPYSPQAIF